jgi:hypothetical protein
MSSRRDGASDWPFPAHPLGAWYVARCAAPDVGRSVAAEPGTISPVSVAGEANELPRCSCR